MEARLQRVEADVVDVRHDVQKVRENVQEVKETVMLLDDRQERLHNDIRDLTDALGKASGEVSKLNTWVHKRGAFVAGVTFVVGVIASSVAAALTIAKDWFTG